MAMTERMIRVNFQNAKNQAQRLEEIAGEIRNLSQDSFGGTLQEISQAWKGDNAQAYLKKGQILQDEMTKASDNLRQVARDIMDKAQAIYNAEMNALEIARRRDVN